MINLLGKELVGAEVGVFRAVSFCTLLQNCPNIKKLFGKDFLETSGLKESELDIFDGSPPCSAFSVSSEIQ